LKSKPTKKVNPRGKREGVFCGALGKEGDKGREKIMARWFCFCMKETPTGEPKPKAVVESRNESKSTGGRFAKGGEKEGARMSLHFPEPGRHGNEMFIKSSYRTEFAQK